ncbi:MAG: polysaccharide deacetylase family protein [bacterium]
MKNYRILGIVLILIVTLALSLTLRSLNQEKNNLSENDDNNVKADDETSEEPEEDLEDLRLIMEQQARKYPETFYLAAPDTEKRIALTFDDGPDELNTPVILDILAEKNVKATFFLLGENVKLFPEITKRIHDEGHQIGNHSWSHDNFRELENEQVLNKEILPTSEKIEEITGLYPRLLRPPFGAINDETIETLGEKNWQIVNWSIDSYDWHISRDNPDEIVNRMKRLHHPGGIVLLHNNFQSRVTTEALADIIETLKEKGYQFNTIAELLY